MFHESNCTIVVIGIDIGRNPFHVVGHDQRGAIVLRQKWSRGQVEAQLANLPRATSAFTGSGKRARLRDNEGVKQHVGRSGRRSGIGSIADQPIADLRRRYRELFRAEPPKAFGPDLLRRAIAQRIQERTYGGLPRATQRLLDQLIKAAAAANLIKSCCKPLPVPMLGSST
jgi:Protein of unknown function (DUF2924)